MKKCSFCAEEIQDDAIKCRHCGEFLKAESKEVESKVSVKTISNETNEVAYLGKPSHVKYLLAYLIGGLYLLGGILMLISALTDSKMSTGANLSSSISSIILSTMLLLYGKIARSVIEYKISNYKVSSKSGLLRQVIHEVPINDIQYVRISRTFIDRMFNVGNVDFASAGTAGIEITFKAVKEPEKVRDIADKLRKQKQT